MKNNIKREDGNIACWVLFILSILYSILGISEIIHSTNITILGDVLIFGFIYIVIIGLTIMFFHDSKVIKTVSINSYEFQIWDSDKSEYVTRYDFTQTKLMADFYLTFRGADFETTPSIEELKKVIENELYWNQHRDTYPGYKTKEEVMKQIKEVIKNILAERKVKDNGEIINISFGDCGHL